MSSLCPSFSVLLHMYLSVCLSIHLSVCHLTMHLPIPAISFITGIDRETHTHRSDFGPISTIFMECGTCLEQGFSMQL